MGKTFDDANLKKLAGETMNILVEIFTGYKAGISILEYNAEGGYT